MNTGRQLEIDWLKAFCIVLMIFNHVYSDDADAPGPLGSFIDDILLFFLGAGTFMFCMGIGMRYSRNQGPKAYAYRGFCLLSIGQFLNLLRNVIPNLIGWWFTGKFLFFANALLVIQADILSFAGLAFLLMALLKKLRAPDRMIFLISILMNLLGWAVYHTVPDTKSYMMNQLLGFVTVTDAESFFPLTSYFIFVVAGYLVGGVYPHIRDKQALARRMLIVGIPICAVVYAFRMIFAIPFFPEFGSALMYTLCPAPDALIMILTSMVALAFFTYVVKWSGNRIPRAVEHISTNINSYYCVSYVLILPVQTILIGATGRLLPHGAATIWAILVCFISAGIIELNRRYIHFTIMGMPVKKQRIFFAVVWAATIAVILFVYPHLDEYATMWNDYLLPANGLKK